jgi:hypothetical protein
VLVRCCYREATQERRRRRVEIHVITEHRTPSPTCWTATNWTAPSGDWMSRSAPSSCCTTSKASC